MIMCDWVTAVVPFYYPGIISDGDVLFRDQHGLVERRTIKRKTIEGTYSDGITIRTKHVDSDGNTTHIEISGNPVKFLQGHNIFGSSDAVNLTLEVILIIIDALDAPQPEHVINSLFSGAWTLSCVDYNKMFDTGSRANCLAYLYSTGNNSRTKSKGAIMKGSTVYLNKGSKRWEFKLYCKAQEIEVKRKKKSNSLILPPAMVEFVQPMVRTELRLKSNELREHKNSLYLAANLVKIEPEDLFYDYYGRLTMATQIAETGLTNEIKSRPVAASYQLWLDGHDVRQILPKNTFYRHRKYLLENHSIDISLPPPDPEKPCSNVVPLRKTIELKEAHIPSWAYGTNLLFEPRKLCTG